MGIKKWLSGLQTATGTTDSLVSPKIINGRVLAVELVSSGTSTDFKIKSLKDESTTLREYILGGAASVVTVTSSTMYYPKRIASAISNGDALTGDKNIFIPVVIDGRIQIDVSNTANSETWSCIIFYEEDY